MPSFRITGPRKHMPTTPMGSRGIDRIAANIETDRFARSLSALSAAGALVTAAESFFGHDSASLRNKMMWVRESSGR
jgi:hypothetical protein